MALTLLPLLASLAVVVQLFVTLSLVSSAFLAPALAALADALVLDEPTAGVTLLALGNAAPDAAGALAAVRRGAAQLALGELLGAGAFVSTFVAGVVILTTCPSYQSPAESRLALPRRSFARDIASLVLVLSGALAGIVLFSGFTLHACLAFLALYGLYASDVLAPPVGLRLAQRLWRPSHTGPIHLPLDGDPAPSGDLPLPATSTSPRTSPEDDQVDAQQHALTLGVSHSLLGALEFRDVVSHLGDDAAHARHNTYARSQALSSPPTLALDAPRRSLFRFSSEGAVPLQSHHTPWSAQAWRDTDPADFLSSSSSDSSRRASADSTNSAPSMPFSAPGEVRPIPLSRSSSSNSHSTRHGHWETFRLALIPTWPVIRGKGGESLSTRVLALLSTPPLFLFLLTIPLPASADEHAEAQSEPEHRDDSVPPGQRKRRDPAAQARSRATARAAARAKVLPPVHAGTVPGFVLWSLWPRQEAEGSNLLNPSMTRWLSAPLQSTALLDWWESLVQSLSPIQAALVMALAGWTLYVTHNIWAALGWGLIRLRNGAGALPPDRLHAPQRSVTGISSHSLHALGPALGLPGTNTAENDDLVPPGIPTATVDSPPAYEQVPFQPGSFTPSTPVTTHPEHSSWRQVAPLALAFATSVLWITTTVDRLIDVLEEVGETLGVSEAVLGATVFAFGNSLGDLVANLALARVHPHMALAACFATPLLNLTLGVGLAGSLTLLFPPQGNPSLDIVMVHPTPPLLIAGGGCVLSLLLLLAYLARSSWTLNRCVGQGLFLAYACMFVAGMVFELGTRYSSAT